MEKSNCAPYAADIALYVDDANGKNSRPFLIFGGDMPVIHATWTAPNRVVFDIVGHDIDVSYARDREQGIAMNYTLRPAPAGEPPKL